MNDIIATICAIFGLLLWVIAALTFLDIVILNAHFINKLRRHFGEEEL